MSDTLFQQRAPNVPAEFLQRFHAPSGPRRHCEDILLTCNNMGLLLCFGTFAWSPFDFPCYLTWQWTLRLLAYISKQNTSYTPTLASLSCTLLPHILFNLVCFPWQKLHVRPKKKECNFCPWRCTACALPVQRQLTWHMLRSMLAQRRERYSATCSLDVHLAKRFCFLSSIEHGLFSVPFPLFPQGSRITHKSKLLVAKRIDSNLLEAKERVVRSTLSALFSGQKVALSLIFSIWPIFPKNGVDLTFAHFWETKLHFFIYFPGKVLWNFEKLDL